jgi:hypothetical protein
MKPLTPVSIAVATLVVDVGNRNSLRIPRLEVNLGGP